MTWDGKATEKRDKRPTIYRKVQCISFATGTKLDKEKQKEAKGTRTSIHTPCGCYRDKSLAKDNLENLRLIGFFSWLDENEPLHSKSQIKASFIGTTCTITILYLIENSVLGNYIDLFGSKYNGEN